MTKKVEFVPNNLSTIHVTKICHQQTILTSRLQYNESYKNNKTFLFDNCTELLLQK